MGLTQVPLSEAFAAVIGLAAFGALVFDVGWRIIRHGTVMAHEGAHALVGALLFRNVSGIVLDADAGGATSMDSGGCLGSVAVSFVGYVGPSLFGLGAAKLIELGHIVTVLWVTLFLLGILLTGLRRSFGMITVILVGGLVYLIGRYTPVGAQITAAYAISWMLLLSGVRRVIEVGVASADGADLRSLTGVPRFLWFLLWLAATVAAVAIGGNMLVMRK
jgi:Peptidase M50B-like